MSRYLLLVLLNAPLIILSIIGAIIDNKVNRLPKRRLYFRITAWVLLLIGLIFAQPAYNYLFSHNLTVSESLSLFDVIQITMIILLLYITNRERVKIENLEGRLNTIHQELSIKFSDQENR